ncbi:helix-turn-helix transcriptional regulator [Nocardia rhizosphaerae]|uniref:LuxR C-terminal-related transcriptional regulator n=1 Tax=Nocardia rhizosphaerae TaxID=1691571 RepID=A0ABV8L7A8_9NOCA
MAGIVGRADLTAALSGAWRRTCAGAGGVVVLLGEAGIGKSSMLGWLAGRIGARARLVTCHAGDLGGPMSAAADVAATLGGHAAAVAAEIDPLRAAELLHAALAEITEPVAVLIDDIHDADPASRTALNLLLRRASWSSVLVVVTGRPVPATVAFAEGFDVHQLTGLDEASSLRLLHAASRDPIADPIARRLLETAAGNPLALTHLPAALSAEQLRGARLLPDDIPLAGDLHRVFTGQLARRSGAARDLLALAAVAGDARWAVLTALRPADPAGVLAELEDAGLAELAGGRLVFAHPLLRHAATSTLSARQRRALNLELAAVAELPAQVRLAHRAAGALGPDEALADELVTAARLLRGRGGTETAARLLDRAIDLTGDDPRRARLRLAAAEMLGAAGEAAAARSRLAEVLADPAAAPLHTHASMVLATLESLDGDPAAGWQRLLECLPVADPAELGDVHARMTIPLGMLGLVGQIIEHADAALAHCAARSPGWQAARVIAAHAISARDEARAGALVTELLDDLDPAVVVAHDPTAGLHLGRALSIAERYDTAVSVLTELSGRAKGDGARASLAMIYGALGETYIRCCRFDRATPCLDEAIALSLATGQRAFAPFWLALRARAAAIRGDDAAAAADLELGFGICTSQSTWGARYFLLANAGHAALTAGRNADAVELLTECWTFEQTGGALSPQLARWHPDLIEAGVAVGDRPAVRSVLDYLRTVAAAPGASRWTRASARRAEAIFRADDDPAAALALLDEAVAIYDPDADLFDLARAQLQRAALRPPDRSVAARHAGQAFDRLHAAAWAARLVALDGGPTDARSISTKLTAAELRVLGEVARGLSNQQIATHLRVSPKTVANHLFRVYRKLGASSRTEAARLLLLDSGTTGDHGPG